MRKTYHRIDTLSGNVVNLKGSTIDFNPGGVASAAKASGDVSESPDPVKA